eukprot:Sspe_Gene.117094::Locus_107748_Transcript_1_1_Confidence_1.000_Length_385::g.117094::m.117094
MMGSKGPSRGFRPVIRTLLLLGMWFWFLLAVCIPMSVATNPYTTEHLHDPFFDTISAGAGMVSSASLLLCILLNHGMTSRILAHLGTFLLLGYAVGLAVVLAGRVQLAEAMWKGT